MRGSRRGEKAESSRRRKGEQVLDPLAVWLLNLFLLFAELSILFPPDVFAHKNEEEGDSGNRACPDGQVAHYH